MGKDKAKVIKTGIPKRKELKDFEQQFNLTADLDTLKMLFQHAIPQLGRELSKSNLYDNYRTKLMTAAGLASDTYAALDSSKADNFYQLLNALAEAAGYERDSWTITDKCGNEKRFSWEDLYDSTSVELIIRVTTPLKDEKALATAGIK